MNRSPNPIIFDMTFSLSKFCCSVEQIHFRLSLNQCVEVGEKKSDSPGQTWLEESGEIMEMLGREGWNDNKN